MDYYCKSATMFLYLTPTCCIETHKHNTTKDEMAGSSSPQVSRHKNSNPQVAQTKNSSPKIPRSSPQVSKNDQPSPDISQRFVNKSKENVSEVNRKSSTSSRTSNSSIQPELRPQETLEFMSYLQNAKSVISACKRDCKCWSAVYDGMDVVTENPRNTRSSLSRASERSASDSSDGGLDEIKVTTTEVLGPFLNAIFDRLETMLESNVYVNLLLTGLVARLASYPQPLLRSFLLNSNLVIRPGVRSLALVSFL